MNGNHDIGDKKISRFQFLKLLGACAIGYFAYRAGFINSLIRSAAAAGTQNPMPRSAGWLSALSPTTARAVDEDGILMIATPN